MAPSSLNLVTGGAGFIGSHVVERLLSQGHRVRVLDNFSTGSRANLDFAKGNGRLEVIRGDLKSLTTVERAVRGVTAVFHQAAMRSVPRSVADPLGAHASNATGTLHLLVAAARQKKKPRVVYAAAPASAVSGKSFNVGCGSRTSLLEIIASLEGLLGRALTAKHSPTRVGDVPHTLADISAAKRDMGYEPVVAFDEGLRRTVDYF